MINPKELRLGVTIEQGTVIVISDNYVTVKRGNEPKTLTPEQCIPLPITQAELEKLGFAVKDFSYNHSVMAKAGFSFPYDSDDGGFLMDNARGSFEMRYNEMIILVKYIHEVENILFNFTSLQISHPTP